MSGRLVVGVGCSLGCPPEELAALVQEALADATATAPPGASAPYRRAATGMAPTATVPAPPASSASPASSAVAAVASVDRRAEEPCVVALAEALGAPLVVHPAAALATVPVPTPSAAVLAHVGTPSVAEAAALLSAGAGGVLVVPKQRSPHATCAIAQEAP